MREITVYEVLHKIIGPGRMQDGVDIFRTRTKREAETFAVGREAYGGIPAMVETCSVPANIVKRWGL